MVAVVGYGGDPHAWPEGEDDLLLRADAELREAAADVERLVREDCERFLAVTDQQPRRSATTVWLRLPSCGVVRDGVRRRVHRYRLPGGD